MFSPTFSTSRPFLLLLLLQACRARVEGDVSSLTSERKECLDRIDFNWDGYDVPRSRTWEVEVAVASTGEAIVTATEKKSDTETDIATEIHNFCSGKVSSEFVKNLIDLCKYQKKHGEVPLDGGNLHKWYEEQAALYAARGSGRRGRMLKYHCELLEKFAGFVYGGKALMYELKEALEEEEAAESNFHQESSVQIIVTSGVGDFTVKSQPNDRNTKRPSVKKIGNLIKKDFPTSSKAKADLWQRNFIAVYEYQITKGSVPNEGKLAKWLKTQAYQYAAKKKDCLSKLSREECLLLEQHLGFVYLPNGKRPKTDATTSPRRNKRMKRD